MDIEIKSTVPEIAAMVEILNMKNRKIEALQEAVNSETTLKLDYEHKYNEWLISPELTEKVKEHTGESRPTVDMKKAYIIEQLKTEYDDLKIAEANSSLIRRDLELIDNLLSAEKYVLNLELQQRRTNL